MASWRNQEAWVFSDQGHTLACGGGKSTLTGGFKAADLMTQHAASCPANFEAVDFMLERSFCWKGLFVGKVFLLESSTLVLMACPVILMRHMLMMDGHLALTLTLHAEQPGTVAAPHLAPGTQFSPPSQHLHTHRERGDQKKQHASNTFHGHCPASACKCRRLKATLISTALPLCICCSKQLPKFYFKSMIHLFDIRRWP